MKTITVFIFALCFTLKSFSQETCNAPKEDIIDPNSLSISKCKVEAEIKVPSRKIIKTTPTSRKRITNRFKTNPQDINSNLSLSADLKTTLTTNSKINPNSNKLKVKTILFDLVDEVPLFSTCSDKNKTENSKCFRNKIQTHFTNNFNPEAIAEDEISGKVIIKFDVSIEGKIENIEILSSKKSENLNNEVSNVFSKLSNIKPGKVNSLPVNVTYVFPINLTLE